MARPNVDTIDSASEQAGRFAGYAERTVDAAKDAAADATERLTSIAKDAISDPQAFADETYNSVTRYTQEKPLQALAITAGVAFVVGALWKR